MSNPETLLPVHPRTGLRAVGVVAGRPVWPVLGAEDDPANPVPPPAPGTLPQDPPPAAPPAPPAPVPAPPPGDPAPVFDAAYVQGLRHESASYRTRAKEQETAREAAEKAAQEAAAKATQLEG